MKKVLTILAAAATVALLAASCSKESTYTAGPAENKVEVEYYFAESGLNAELDPAAPTFSVDIKRSKAEGDVKLPITVKYNQGNAYSVPEYAEFVDGQDQATIEIAQKGTVGEKYILEIALPESVHTLYKQNVKTYAFKAITQAVSWTTLSKGTYTSCYIPAFETELQKCDQNNNYRFKPFGKADALVLVPQGKAKKDKQGDEYLEFTVAKQDTGYSHSSYGAISVQDVSTWQASSSYITYNNLYTDYTCVAIWSAYMVSQGCIKYGDDLYEGKPVN